jgi:hypothetical protein
MTMRFRDLPIGATFDFNAPDRVSTFSGRCVKISARRYTEFPVSRFVYRVGTINVEVFHTSW